MFSREQLKANAKQQLSGNWGMGVAATLIILMITNVISSIFFGLSYIPMMVSVILSGGEVDETMALAATWGNPLYYLGLAASLLVGAIFFYGSAKFYLGLSRTNKADISDLFSAFKLFGKVLCAYLLVTLYTFLWSLLFIIPGIVAAYRYRMVPYLLADNPDIGASEALRQSKTLMQGHKGELFVLDLSFIGWSLLAALTCGIGTLWLTPYMEMTFANYYDALNNSGSYQTPSSGTDYRTVWDPEQ